MEAARLADLAGHGHRPARDRRDDADRRGGRVDEVGQLFTGDAQPVGDRAHDGADRETVEAVVDKDQDAEQRGGKGGGAPAVQLLPRPAAVGLAAARFGHQHDHRPEQREEDDHVGVVGDLGVHHVEGHGDGGEKIPAAGKGTDEHAGEQADEQRGIDLLGDQRQRDGNDGRQKGYPSGFDHRKFHILSSCYLYFNYTQKPPRGNTESRRIFSN